MKTWTKYLISIIVIAILATTFYKKIYIPKTTFKTITPTLGELQVSVKGIGNIGALNIYSITAQTGGKILKILSDNGMWVKKGDLLVVMDGVDLPQQLEIAKANLKKAKYEVIASQSELENLKAQKVLIVLTYNRYERLKKQGFVAKSEYDKANADLQSIKANITASSSKINSALSAVTASLKSIDAIKVKISRLKVYAPVDGFVISKEAEVSQNVLPSTPILKIVDPKTLWVQTKIDERISSQIKAGQKATIILRSQADKIYTGSVKRIEAMSDAVTFEREIDVVFDTIPNPFYINEQAQVQINVKKYNDVLKVPLKVVVQRGGKLGMWILKDNHAHFLKIEKIAQSDSEIAISNLDKNSKIIIPDISKKPLSDGMKIHK
jgi:RND family efflux transporter MFP subunit